MITEFLWFLSLLRSAVRWDPSQEVSVLSWDVFELIFCCWRDIYIKMKRFQDILVFWGEHEKRDPLCPCSSLSSLPLPGQRMHWSHPGEKKLTGGHNWQNKTMTTTQWGPAPVAPQPMPVQHVVRRPCSTSWECNRKDIDIRYRYTSISNLNLKDLNLKGCSIDHNQPIVIQGS